MSNLKVTELISGDFIPMEALVAAAGGAVRGGFVGGNELLASVDGILEFKIMNLMARCVDGDDVVLERWLHLPMETPVAVADNAIFRSIALRVILAAVALSTQISMGFVAFSVFLSHFD